MKIKLYNSLTKKKEEFKPIHIGKVGVYACGPTVYHDVSVGNFRTFIFTDILRRVLEFNGYEVKLVMNITDVGHLTDDGNDGEDKMIVAMRREGKTAWEIADFYTHRFLSGLKALNVKMPTVLPKATEHIDDQIRFIQDLEKNGFAYKISDGIYFDTSKIKDYGKLAGQRQDEKIAGARVEVNQEKRNPADFALWKFSQGDEKRQMEWNSPWGVGFPGWHIECSAMSEKYLDTPFDIHVGGSDLAPVHHTNEIAQTIGARGCDPVNIWMHGAFLQIDGGKMSKSLGNVYNLDDLKARGFSALVFRYFVLGAHYRSLLNFTWEAMQGAQNALNNLEDIVREWDNPTTVDKKYLHLFFESINDDLNTSEALSVMWSLVNDSVLSTAIKSATLLEFDKVLGLSLDKIVAVPLIVPKEIEELLNERKQAREEKNWVKSDEIRNHILEIGYKVEDTENGQRIREFR